MKNKYIKNISKYTLIFILLLFASTFTTLFGNDEAWNFGFINNIYNGLIPYKDFNMVITPFYPIFMSIPLHIFGNNEIVVQILNCIVIVFSLILIEKLTSNNSILSISSINSVSKL